MRFLKTLFNRSINTDRRSLNKRSKTLSLESLEQRIALDASGVRPQLEPVREVHIDNSLVGPDPMVFGKSELVGHGTKSFVITAVASGSTVEKWDAAANQWRDVSTPPTSSNPRQLLQLLQNRIIQKDDQVRWIPKSTDGLTQKAFEIIGWDDGSETSEPEGVNVPGAVENLEIELVGDEVRVTWDPPTTGAAVTHYRIHQNPTTVLPSTQTSHTFAKVASPSSYAVTVHANSAEGAGEATTVTLSHASYQKTDGTIVDPILDTSGKVLDYDGPNLRLGANLTKVNLKDADLFDAQLTGANLTGATLTGADLSDALMPFAHLNGAIMTIANLNGANFWRAELTGADLSGADLTSADLTTAILTNVKSGGITFDGTPPPLPTDWQLIDGYLVGPGADLTDADLTGVNLTNADLTGANLTGADLTGATLTDVRSGGITFDGTPPPLPTDWQLIDGYLVGPGADLTDAELTGANLTGANLTGANLSGATLTDVRSGGITFDGTPPPLPTDWQLIDGYLVGPGADLTDAELTGANLTGANLTDADLYGADLSDATMIGANLTDADLTNATLINVKSGDVTGCTKYCNDITTLPTDWKLVRGYLVGPGADLRGADLSDVDYWDFFFTLTGANLTGANLTNAYLGGADLTGATLTGATVMDMDLVWIKDSILTNVKSGGLTGVPYAIPTDWQLIDGYLIGPTADLTGADLNGANLTGADLTSATLTNVKSGGITFDGTPPPLPTDWQLIDGYLIGPTADLTGADLTGADLTSADLTGATLTNVKSGGITFDGTPPPLPTDWQLIDGYLVGPGANLTGADLTGVNLTNADLTNVKSGGITYNGTPPILPTDWQLIEGIQSGGYLIGPGADLSSANLLAANLQGANLSGADLTEATLAFVQSGNTITDVNTTLPTDWKSINGYLIGPGANLTGADLTGANLTGADLTRANLFNAKLDGANLSNATLLNVVLSTVATLTNVKSGGITGPLWDSPTDWQLIDGYLIGPTADLTGADLANLDLNGIDLSNAILTGVQSGGITGTPSHLPANWQLIDGYLIGPGANLFAADLTNTDLSGADLSGANLVGVRSGGITVTSTPPALPTDWQLIDGYLIGTGADLADADLTHQDLTGASLRWVTGVRMHLDHAILANTDLRWANLTDATLTNVSGAAKYNSATILPAGFDPVAAGWTLVS